MVDIKETSRLLFLNQQEKKKRRCKKKDNPIKVASHIEFVFRSISYFFLFDHSIFNRDIVAHSYLFNVMVLSADWNVFGN